MRRIEDELDLDEETAVLYEPWSGKYIVSQEKPPSDKIHTVLMYSEEAKRLAKWILEKEQSCD